MIFEGLGLVLVVLLLAGVVFLWKLGQGPVSVNFAKDYIESALKDDENGFHVNLDTVSLEWPNYKGPILLRLDEVKLFQKDNPNPALSVHRAGISVSYRFLLIGKIRPVSVILDQPSVTLVRKDGDIDFFLQDVQIPEKPVDAPAVNFREEMLRVFENAADPQFRRGAILEAFRSIRIRDANAVIRDYEQGFSWHLSDLDFILRERKQGINAVLDLNLSDEGDVPANLQIGITYTREPRAFAVTAEMQNVNPDLFSKLFPDTIDDQVYDLPVSGAIQADFDDQLMLRQANINLNIPKGTVDIPTQFDAPLDIAEADLKAFYEDDDQTLTIDTLSFKLNDIPVIASGHAQMTEDGGIVAPVEVIVPRVAQEVIAPVFPAAEKDGDAAKWILYRMSGGVFTDVKASTTIVAKKVVSPAAQVPSDVDPQSFKEGQVPETPADALAAAEDSDADEAVAELLEPIPAEAAEEWKIGTTKTMLAFAFDGVSVDYTEGLTPATNASGSGTMDFAEERLEINGTADIGDIKSSRVHLLFTDIMVSGGGYAQIDFDASGPVSSALDYITPEPIGMGKNLGFDTKGAKGAVDMHVKIALPTKKDLPRDEVKVIIDATMKDVLIPKVVQGLDLTGGPYTLNVAEGSFGVKGSGKLSGRYITLDWKQYFSAAGNPFEAQVKAQLGADPELRKHFGVDLDKYITGTLPVDVTYTDPGNDTATIDIRSSLAPMQIHIDSFRYAKPAGVAGDLSLRAHLVKGSLREISDLNLKTQDFNIGKARLAFGPRGDKKTDLTGGILPDAVIGRTKMAAEFEITPQNILKVSARGPVLDAMPFKKPDDDAAPGAQKKPGQQLMMISVSADTLITGDGEGRAIRNAKLYLETNDTGDITRAELDGVAGKGEVYVRFKPDATGKRTFRMEAADAGAFMYATELYDNARDGRILIYAEPRGDLYGDLFGVARIENFRVVKAPALAQLVNAMSLVGVGQLLNNQGLPFTKLEADFEWRFRSGGNLLIMKNGRTSGTSLGLTFEGTMDQATKMTDIQGTIIPMSEINSVLKNIPIVGDILTGGSGLIAATYTMKGPTEKPVVSVNPLSVLAPGILRTILFEGGFKSNVPERDK